MLNLDTHILVHALAGTLRRNEETLLSQHTWGVAAIVLWELAIARASTDLDFRGDPADELIAATSIVLGVPLVIRDGQIRTSRRVPLALRR